MKVIIRPIQSEEIYETVVIFVECWKNDYKHIVPAKVLESFNLQQEADECKEWLYADCEDVRLLYAAFVDDKMVGYISASLVEDDFDLDYEVEINGLFVCHEYRGKGVGIKLMQVMIAAFKERGFTSVILYNWKELSSNQLYRNLKGEVVKQEVQNCGGVMLSTEIFGWQMDSLLNILNQKLNKYKFV